MRTDNLLCLRRRALIDGRMTFEDWVALIAEHDDEHLDQLTRPLEGRA